MLNRCHLPFWFRWGIFHKLIKAISPQYLFGVLVAAAIRGIATGKHIVVLFVCILYL